MDTEAVDSPVIDHESKRRRVDRKGGVESSGLGCSSAEQVYVETGFWPASDDDDDAQQEALKEIQIREAAFEAAVEQTANLLHGADLVIIAAGAGMSVDSGLPDYRNKAAWCREFPQLARRHIEYSHMAHHTRFCREPRLAWGWYLTRMKSYAAAQPHNGYSTLQSLVETRFKDRHFVFTSNVDGLFRKAKFPASSVVECHGNMQVLQCLNHKDHGTWRLPSKVLEAQVDEVSLLAAQESLPRCRNLKCQDIARPNILLFEDTCWAYDRIQKQTKRFKDWLGRRQADSKHVLVLEVGAGTAVATVRAQCEEIVCDFRGAGAKTSWVRINPEMKSKPSHAHNNVHIAVGAEQALTAICERVTSLYP